jgi:hypothetical protein
VVGRREDMATDEGRIRQAEIPHDKAKLAQKRDEERSLTQRRRLGQLGTA